MRVLYAGLLEGEKGDSMSENAELANIYIKIYNKRPLTMDDLAFLAKYDRECFEKTCHNLIYNVPETEKLMKKDTSDSEKKEAAVQEEVEVVAGEVIDTYTEMTVSENKVEIETLLENLKKMEGQAIGLQKLNVENVKHLLGSLFMEMLFPHNDRDKTFQMAAEEEGSTFDKQA